MFFALFYMLYQSVIKYEAVLKVSLSLIFLSFYVIIIVFIRYMVLFYRYRDFV